MPRNTSLDNLRTDLFTALGTPLMDYNASIHRRVREIVVAINDNYIHERNACLGTRPSTYPIGLVLSYESQVEIHTRLEAGYIRWRYGRFMINRSRRLSGKPPITRRVKKQNRAQLHYRVADFAAIPSWYRAPAWEKQLVMYTELKVRPLREALHEYKETQRRLLHSPFIPDIDPSFDDLVL